MKRKVVHCVCKLLMFLVTMPPAAQCPLIVCHNRVRNLLDRICQEGMLLPVMEKKASPWRYGRRPGDVTIPVWRANKGLAIDVAVTSPLASSNLQHSEP